MFPKERFRRTKKSLNRSLKAYNQNPDVDPLQRCPHEAVTNMTLLRFESQDDFPGNVFLFAALHELPFR